METIPPNLQELLLTGYTIRPSDRDPSVAGFALQAQKGSAFFVATRQQLLDIAADLHKSR